MSARSHDDARVRTPSAALLVQLLFVIGAVGTGVVGALAAMIGPKRAAPEPEKKAGDGE